jgi:N-acetyl-S-(2-succino)cysteine monooxygenase
MALQGHPVLFQAGSSEVGREVAARFAEGVFTPQHTLAHAQEFYRDLKERMRKYDRPPEALKVMPGLNAIEVVFRQIEPAELVREQFEPDIGVDLRLQEMV